MDRTTVLVREAVQNSWDALAPDSNRVEFGIDLGTLSPEQVVDVAGTIFATVPTRLPLVDRLREAINLGAGVRTLAIWDRGTTGLRGPTRADATGEEGEGSDFVDFLRNVGQAPNRAGAGGTYGYGKASLYLASHAHAICVYSQCDYRGSRDTRFMAAGLGNAYVDGDVRRTGRHWWGRLERDVVEPLHGEEAEEAAAKLGLLPFGSKLGTTIVVLDPVLDDRSSEQAAARIVEALLWYCWPKMLEWPDSPATMRFAVTCAGRSIPIPDPRTFPPLQGFVEAMRQLKEGASARRPSSSALEVLVESIESQRPSAFLGRLSVAKFGVLPRQTLIDGDADDDEVGTLIPASSHHVALLRAPELVVKYLEGPLLTGSVVEYGGVFLVDRSVEQAFSLAEPPTHDDWLPDNLEDAWHRRYVRVSQRRIAEVLQQFASPPAVAPEGGAEGLLGSFSDQLGALFLGVEGHGAAAGAGSDGRGSGGGGRGGRAAGPPAILRLIGGPRLDVVDGQRGLIVDFEITEVDAGGAIVSASPSVLLDGGAPEIDPPAGVARPEIIGWIGANGGRNEQPELLIGPDDIGRWRLLVAIPSDALVTVSLDVSAADGQT